MGMMLSPRAATSPGSSTHLCKLQTNFFAWLLRKFVASQPENHMRREILRNMLKNYELNLSRRKSGQLMWRLEVLNETWREPELTTSLKLKTLMKGTDKRCRRQRRSNGVTTARQRLFTGVVGTRPTAARTANRHTGVGSTRRTARGR